MRPAKLRPWRLAHGVLDAAYQVGLRYFAAATSCGRAEQVIGSWLMSRGLTPEAVTAGSEWCHTYTAGWQAEHLLSDVKFQT
jgi:aryl-alcohol dehydrogenase-like predicted oxidoreductase